MFYKVTRTSSWNEKPCDEAIQRKYDFVDIRTLHSFKEFDKKYGEKEGAWLSEGINHYINEEGYIQRTFSNYVTDWFIENNSLEELMDFNKKYGSIIMEESHDSPNITEIEIYDDWRE